MAKAKSSEVEVTVTKADALEEFNKLRSVLTTTHAEIPALLARERTLSHSLGLAEGRGENVDSLRRQLSETEQQRQAAVRRRTASTEALLQLESDLNAERADAESERQRVAGEVAQEFGRRWREACARLAELRAEAEVLSDALRSTILTPAPFMAYTHPVTGTPSVRPLAGAEPPLPSLPGHLTELVAHLDALDAALGRIGAIKQAKILDARFFSLSRLRGNHGAFSGVFTVVAQFNSQVDGLEFEAGSLVDTSLVGAGSMDRLTRGRVYIRPAELAA